MNEGFAAEGAPTPNNLPPQEEFAADTATTLGERRPRLLVFSTLFPHPGQPSAGLFIRERMFRVGMVLPITVVAPVPWFPLQSLIRLFRPHFRPAAPKHEVQHGIEVWHPRFLSVPGAFKWLDGLLMALGSFSTMRRLKRGFRFDIIDAHFGYPDGYAATLLGSWLDVPVTVTLRGTEVPHSRQPKLRPRLIRALERAVRLFSVSQSLKDHAVSLGIDERKTSVVGNGVDTVRFARRDRTAVRRSLDIDESTRVIVSVGALTERKGFHRVIELLPRLRIRFPDLLYLVIGGAGPEGDWGPQLRQLASSLGVSDCVRFLGVVRPDDLSEPLSAADLFVLATRNEGWANVFLEAMCCGLPVVATDVGGNAEVVCREEVGTIVPFGDPDALLRAIDDGLSRSWDREAIVAYARENEWSRRVATLVSEFGNVFDNARADRLRHTQGQEVRQIA
jgi:glycosyltransferase involved in cell wall biosynthesis